MERGLSCVSLWARHRPGWFLPSQWGGGTVKARGPGPAGGPPRCPASTSPTNRKQGAQGQGAQTSRMQASGAGPVHHQGLHTTTHPPACLLSRHWPGLPWEEAWAINDSPRTWNQLIRIRSARPARVRRRWGDFSFDFLNGSHHPRVNTIKITTGKREKLSSFVL